MKKIIIIGCILLTIATLNKRNVLASNDISIPQEAIRFRIIANSNESIDQALKLNIKDQFQKDLFPLLASANNIKDARNIIVNNINEVDNILSTYKIPYKVSYGNNYFPEKEFKGVNYNAGNYESLVVTLGDGIGDNWWCVLFPPLCLLEAEENDTDEVEYKSFVKELINKYF